MLAKQRKVEVVHGAGKFAGPNVDRSGQGTRIRFEQCIIAAGSEPMRLPGLPDDPRIMDSTGALELPEFDGRLLVIGGGIIGLEMACVYDALGSKVSVVELTPQLMPGCDPDLVRPLEKRMRARYEQILLGTKVEGSRGRQGRHSRHVRRREGAAAADVWPRAGRRRPLAERQADRRGGGGREGDRSRLHPGRQADAHERAAHLRDRRHRRPAHARAQGDARGESGCGSRGRPQALRSMRATIPSVAYTDPEVAWVGLTETEAKAKNIAFKKAAFPWAASGRSLSLGRDEGFTKLLFDPETHRVLGGGIVGTNAGELIAEVALAIEMGADASDIGLTIHPHPDAVRDRGLRGRSLRRHAHRSLHAEEIALARPGRAHPGIISSFGDAPVEIGTDPLRHRLAVRHRSIGRRELVHRRLVAVLAEIR